MKRRNWFW